MYSTLTKRTQVIVLFLDWLFKSNAQQILGGQWCSQDRWEGYKAERNFCISIASVAPLAPSVQRSNVIPVPAPSALFPESRTQCLCSLPCPSLHHSSLGTQHSRYTVDCLAFILPPPPLRFSPVFPPRGCLLCSFLSSGSNSAWHLEGAWQTLFEQSNPTACAGLQLLVCFLPFVNIAVPWYPWRLGPGLPADTKVHGCSGYLYKMVQCLHRTNTTFCRL